MKPLVSSSLAGTSVPKNQPDTGLDTVRDFSHAGAQIRLNWRGQTYQQLSVITPTDGPFWSSVEMTMGQARAVAAIVAEFDRVNSPKTAWNPSLEEHPEAGASVVKEAFTTGLNPNKNPSGEDKVPLMGQLSPLLKQARGYSPKGADSRTLQCSWCSIRVLGPRALAIDLPPLNCVDMVGAIRVATGLMPEVRMICTLSDGIKDTTYTKIDGNWQACRDSSAMEVLP